LFLHSCVLV